MNAKPRTAVSAQRGPWYGGGVGNVILICKYCRDVPELSQFKAEFFKALAHPLRIGILDALRNGEVSVNQLCSRLRAEQTTVSQQLAILRNRDIVVGRKNGGSVFYSVRDPAIFKLLDVAKETFNNRLVSVRELLSQLDATTVSNGS